MRVPSWLSLIHGSDDLPGAILGSLPQTFWKRGGSILLMVLALMVVSADQGSIAASFLSKGPSASILQRGRLPWKVTADRLIYKAKSKIYQAEGSVRIVSGDKSIEADWAQINTMDKTVQLEGRVFLRFGKDWLRGEHVIWHLDTETGWVDGGTVYFSDNGFYVSGANILKTGPREYRVAKGEITTCDPRSPAWSITCRDLKVKVGGTGFARNAAFRVGSIPVFYTPLAFFPVNRHRQSGFLLPMASSSKLNGLELELPYYWAIRRDLDATFYPHMMEKRGLMLGAEVRANSSTWGKGILLVDYLSDHADKDHLESMGYPFQQEDRYWIRARHSFRFPFHVEGFLDVDLVSDRNFLKEFDKGSASLEFTNDAFSKFSDREVLNDKTVLSRESNLYLVRRWESSVAALGLSYWDQLDRSLNETTLQQLPRLTYSLVPSNLPFGLGYFSLESELVDYWRQEGDKGLRWDIHPILSHPLHLGDYLDVEPSIGTRATLYEVNWEKRDSNLKARFLPDVRIEMTSRIQRVYAMKFGHLEAIQHVFQPEISYEYLPDVDQDSLPIFDRLDRIPKRSVFRYGFSTYLTTKKESLDIQGSPFTRYHELARLKVTQDYRLNGTFTQGTFIHDPKKRFSDVQLELDLTPEKSFRFSYDLNLSPYDGKASLQDLTLDLVTPHNHSISLTYRYRPDTTIDEIIASLKLNLLPNLSLTTYQDYSFEAKDLFKQSYGIHYRHGCWGFRAGYTEEARDRQFNFAIELVGLGKLGGGFSPDSVATAMGLP